MQTTVRSPLSFRGVGLHSGRITTLRLLPASAEHGIWFRRTDVLDRDPLVAARWDRGLQTPLCTKIENADGVSVATIEHVMAALAGCGVHNALIEIDGPEVPVLDGSAAPFVEEIIKTGLQALDAPVRAIQVCKTVRVENGEAWAELSPANTLEIDFEIDFSDAAIGHQEKRLNMANGAFVRELCDSRTFCRESDVTAMRAQGLALGGTFENAVVVDGARVLSPGGLRHKDEAVRHKMLDALGDLYLAGAPMLARYSGHRAGHALTNLLLRKLFATPGAVRMVVCDDATVARLPGHGVTTADLAVVA